MISVFWTKQEEYHDKHFHFPMNAMEIAKEVTFTLRIRPGKQRTQWEDDAADGTPVLSLAARAQDNEANAALIRFLATEYNVPMANVTIVSGHGSRTKRVRIHL